MHLSPNIERAKHFPGTYPIARMKGLESGSGLVVKVKEKSVDHGFAARRGIDLNLERLGSDAC